MADEDITEKFLLQTPRNAFTIFFFFFSSKDCAVPGGRSGEPGKAGKMR